MSKKSFSVRRFETSDVGGIIKLFKLVFENPFSTEWWSSKYRLNPAGFYGEKGDVWIAQASNGEIIGHWAVIPEKMKLKSKTVVVAQAVDAATHPSYRGQGIFKKLVKNVCSDAKKRYDFVFGFPNELYKGYEKLGWKSFPMTEFLNFISYQPLNGYFKSKITMQFAKMALKILQTRNHLSISVHSKKLSGARIEVEETPTFPDEIEEFWRLTRSNYEIIVERDSSFLNWRFSKHFGDYKKLIARSADTGEIMGYVVVKRTNIRGIKGVLEIVDLQALPYEDACIVELVESAINLARENGLDIIHTRVPKGHIYAKILHMLGFVSIGKILEYAGLYQPRLIIYPLTENMTLDVKRWFCTLADTDYA